MIRMIRALLQALAGEHPLRVRGVTLVGMNGPLLIKVLLTLCLLIVLAFFYPVRATVRAMLRGSGHEHVYFWSRQAIRLLAAALPVLVILASWFDDPFGYRSTSVGRYFACRKTR